MNLSRLAKKIRVKAHCLVSGQELSIKGEVVIDYLDRVLKGEISESDKIQDYEELIEWVMEDNGYDRERACQELKEVLEEMTRPWKE